MGSPPGQPYVFVVTARNSVGESAPSAPSAAIVPDAVPSVPARTGGSTSSGVSCRSAGRCRTGRFHPGDRDVRAGAAADGAVAEIRDNVSSPLSLERTGSPAPATGSRCGRPIRQGSSDWSAASEPIVPSDKPGRTGEPERPVRLLRRATGERGVLGATGGHRRRARAGLPGAAEQRRERHRRMPISASHSCPSTRTPRSSVSVIARNSRGDGPARPRPSTPPFSRPGQVTGLTVAAQDGVLRRILEPGRLAGQRDRQLRLPGQRRRVTSAGSATSATISGLTMGRPIRSRCGPVTTRQSFATTCGAARPAARSPARPFGALADPTVHGGAGRARRPAGEASSWAFPDGNGRDDRHADGQGLRRRAGRARPEVEVPWTSRTSARQEGHRHGAATA